MGDAAAIARARLAAAARAWAAVGCLAAAPGKWVAAVARAACAATAIAVASPETVALAAACLGGGVAGRACVTSRTSCSWVAHLVARTHVVLREGGWRVRWLQPSLLAVTALFLSYTGCCFMCAT